MKYCTRCGKEYPQYRTQCPNCQNDLIEVLIKEKGNVMTGIISTVFILFLLLELVGIVFYPNVVANVVGVISTNKEEDIFEAVNVAGQNAVSANVTVYSYSFGELSSSQGSGIIIKEENGKYYVLTNNHVVNDATTTKSVSITDYMGNEYITAQVLWKNSDYDLAIVTFSKGSEELGVISTLASSNIEKGEIVVAIGQPNGRLNAISVGKVINYIYIKETGGNSVNFECLIHNATGEHGSSGGMIIDKNGILVGVNTYGGSDGTSMGAIPAEKIKEFLDKCGIEMNMEG